MANKEQPKLVVLPKPHHANASRLGYVGRIPTEKPRDADSWFTPAEYLDSVRLVMGAIDLDPFSSETANEIVGAKWIFTAERSAFESDWKLGKAIHVFMNPPYSSGFCVRAVNKFLDEYDAGSFVEGIVLVNNATDTRWFGALINRCDCVCFTNHRISFWNADRKNVSGNTRGQAFFYFGRKSDKFKKVFQRHGFVLVPARE